MATGDDDDNDDGDDDVMMMVRRFFSQPVVGAISNGCLNGLYDLVTHAKHRSTMTAMTATSMYNV